MSKDKYTDYTDEQLVEMLKKDNLEVFAALSKRYYPMLYGKAYSFSSNYTMDIDDFFQEGLLAIYRCALNYKQEKGASFETYANYCVNNAMIDLIRKQKTGTSTISDLSYEFLGDELMYQISGQETTKLPEEKLEIQQRLNRILDNEKSLFSRYEYQVLRQFLKGFSYSEIADNLSTTAKSVDNALQRIRQKLKTLD